MAFFIATPPPTVHPRWRGEHPLMATINPWKRGSSPLARGTLVLTRGDGLPRRFIPAGAGNTAPGRAASSGASVHPRWRGEHGTSSFSATRFFGSSPLARGTPVAARLMAERGRFIPAGAGNTAWRWWCGPSDPVHPRWRGEHARKVRRHWQSLRFIPAGAGNTVPGCSRSRG